jgi:hypothetical protein
MKLKLFVDSASALLCLGKIYNKSETVQRHLKKALRMQLQYV